MKPTWTDDVNKAAPVASSPQSSTIRGAAAGAEYQVDDASKSAQETIDRARLASPGAEPIVDNVHASSGQGLH